MEITVSILLAMFVILYSGYQYTNITRVSDHYIWNGLESFFVACYRVISLPITVYVCFIASVVIVSLLNFMLTKTIGSIGQLVFSFLILVYCVGAISINVRRDGVLLETHNYLFTILFWFALLGAPGIWAYFVAQRLYRTTPKINEDLFFISRLIWFMQWIPSWLTGFIYALVGDFNPAYQKLISMWGCRELNHEVIVQKAGQAALGSFLIMDEHQLVGRAKYLWTITAAMLAFVVWNIW